MWDALVGERPLNVVLNKRSSCFRLAHLVEVWRAVDH